MPRDRRGRGGLARGAFGAALLILATSACTPLVGGGVLLGLVAVGALTSRCYDYLDVTVFDADGRKTCAATVTASNGKDKFELDSCYYAALTDGRWTLRASLPGFPDALSTVNVDHTHDCARYVQTVELTLNRASAPAKPVLPPPPAAPLPSSTTPPAPAAPAASTAPEAVPAAPASPAPSSAPPDDGSAPSKSGAQPDHLEPSP